MDYLAHHGIKGQRWGVRRYQNEDGSLTDAGRKRYIKSSGELTSAGKKEVARGGSAAQHIKEDAFATKVLGNGRWTSAYNKAADEMNKKLDTINAKYNGIHFNDDFSTPQGQKYVKEVGKAWTEVYSKATLDTFGEAPVKNGKDYVKNMPMMNMYAEFEMNQTQKMEAEFKKDPSLTYAKIYKEMGVDTKSEDPDTYREAEAAWLKKRGW